MAATQFTAVLNQVLERIGSLEQRVHRLEERMIREIKKDSVNIQDNIKKEQLLLKGNKEQYIQNEQQQNQHAVLALEHENEKQKQRVTKAHQISIFSLLLATGALAIISRSPNTTSLPECFKDQSLVIQAVPAVISTSNNKPIYVFICLCQTRSVFQQYHLLSLQKCIQVSVTFFVFDSTIGVIYVYDPGGNFST